MKSKQELVSVIFPVFNAEKFIKETIQSIQNQTHRDFKLSVLMTYLHSCIQ